MLHDLISALHTVLGDFDGLFSNLLYGVENTVLHYGNKSLPVTDGLMSGWKTTSIFGSMVNILLF